jgi:DNA-binding response OmpR family regulator
MPRILIVEDDTAIALGLKNDLAFEGYEVEVARDGVAGFDRARSGAFDLVLLDIMLPGKDGYAVCRELRRAGMRTPVLMLTARALEAEKVLGLEIGADDYVTKPFGSLELRARVKAMLRRATPPERDVYAFGDVEVDFARGEVRRAGRLLETTTLEFKLLAAFVRNRGRLLNRRHLLDLVWGPGTFVTDRVVDNHVVTLRKKIEPDPAQPRYLLNVRGLGYRFDA